MSRPRKFQLGDVVFTNKPIIGADVEAMPYYAIVVDRKADKQNRGEYGMIRTLHPKNGALFGEVFFMPPHLILKTDYHPRKKTLGVYRANNRMPNRGCTCNCCPHEAIPRSDIRRDGTFSWEHDHD